MYFLVYFVRHFSNRKYSQLPYIEVNNSPIAYIIILVLLPLYNETWLYRMNNTGCFDFDRTGVG